MHDRLQLFSRYINRNTSVLDIGCGTGSWVEKISQAFGAKTVGIDVVNYHNRSSSAFCLFDGRWLPFSNDSFDVGILIHVLHHANHPDELLLECDRVTKKHLIIFEDMAASDVQNSFTRLHDFFGNKIKKCFRAFRREHSFDSLMIPMSYNYRTYGQWFATFKQLNFEIDQVISLPQSTMEHGVFVLTKRE